MHYTSYAMIFLYLDISWDLPNGIELSWDDEEWFQEIDYGEIHFCCRFYHEHGHIFHDFPLNKKPGVTNSQEGKDTEGFTKVATKKISTKKVVGPKSHKKVQTHNRIESLQHEKAVETLNKGKIQIHPHP